MVRLLNYEIKKLAISGEASNQSTIPRQLFSAQDSHTLSYIVRKWPRTEQWFDNWFDQSIEALIGRRRRGDRLMGDIQMLTGANFFIINAVNFIDTTAQETTNRNQLFQIMQRYRRISDIYNEKPMPLRFQKSKQDDKVAALVQTLEGQNLAVLQICKIKMAVSKKKLLRVLNKTDKPQANQQIYWQKDGKQKMSDRADLKTNMKLSKDNKFKKTHLRL